MALPSVTLIPPYKHQDTFKQMSKGIFVSCMESSRVVIDVSLYHPLIGMILWSPLDWSRRTGWGFFGSNCFCWVTIYLNVAINLLLDSPPWISGKASAQSHSFEFWVYFVIRGWGTVHRKGSTLAVTLPLLQYRSSLDKSTRDTA